MNCKTWTLRCWTFFPRLIIKLKTSNKQRKWSFLQNLQKVRWKKLTQTRHSSNKQNHSITFLKKNQTTKLLKKRSKPWSFAFVKFVIKIKSEISKFVFYFQSMSVRMKWLTIEKYICKLWKMLTSAWSSLLVENKKKTSLCLPLNFKRF